MLRRVTGDERSTTSFPLQGYAFRPSPSEEAIANFLPYVTGETTYVIEEGGAAVAAASAIPMRQHVRGVVLPMAGIAGVASDPMARRRGHVRTLMDQLLGEMRDTGHVVSALYPFRTSFYERFGYAGLVKPRTVSFSPADLGAFVRRELPGEVRFEKIKQGYEDYRSLTLDLLARRHGFSVFPDFRAVRLRDLDERWLATAWVDGRVVGAVTYRITDYAGELAADDLLTTSPLSRALLLQFFAKHVDQVSRVVATVAADETPELWATDLNVVLEGRVRLPAMNPPMARVLSIEALAGIAVGPGRVSVRIVGDPYVNGEYTLDGASGSLDVARGSSSGPAATVTAAGLSALVYGVRDPDEFGLYGLGDVPPDACRELRSLFPRLLPYVFAQF
ncbi:MAG TPA: GNAT family N-acetyltransferase [Micromonosporaceae bacterium]|nr:GNAT family N-acetyltransferase [Micromonosporaceae bacterium]